MDRMMRCSLVCAAVLALFVWISETAAVAADRMEEATIIGKDKSGQAGAVPTDTRAVQAESKMKKEQAPAGLKSDAPSVGSKEKMEKPRMAEPERKKPEQKRGLGDMKWLWILVIAGAAAALGG